MVKLASAPVSFGFYGTAAAGSIDPQRVLHAMRDAGYTGSELGPPGMLGTPEQTAEAFDAAGLDVVGSYVPLHLAADDETFEADLVSMRQTLAELEAVGSSRPLAILADEGSPDLIADPYRHSYDRSRGLDAAGWALAAQRLALCARLAEDRGCATSFHPHYATYVQLAWEIEELLERTELGLCLDTGHFLLGGADPVDFAGRFIQRINHVHLKDVHLEVVAAAKAAHRSDFEEWWGGLACVLGTGDVPLAATIDVLQAGDYRGWWVVEQDRLPVTPDTWAQACSDQRANAMWAHPRLGAD